MAAPELPYVDTHAITIAVAREPVWAALQRFVAKGLRIPDGNPLATLLGTEPRSGFEVADSVTLEHLDLVGRHRFSRYRLAFELADAPGGATRLSALTYAAFPGVHGRIYRLLVIDSRAHVLATHHALRSVRRLCAERPGT